MGAKVIVLLVVLSVLVCVTDSAIDIEPKHNHYNGYVKDTVELQWEIKGTGYSGIKWATYFNSVEQDIWGTDKDGKRDVKVPETEAYKGRLSVKKDANAVSLVIKDLNTNDTNTYFCTLAVFGGDKKSPPITLLVTGPTKPAPPPKKSNTAAIIGGVCGGVAAVILIIVAVVFYKKNHRAAQEGDIKKEADGNGI